MVILIDKPQIVVSIDIMIIQPYLNSKKSSVPYLYLTAKYKSKNKPYNFGNSFSNARFTNIPKVYDRLKFGVLGYPILKKDNA